MMGVFLSLDLFLFYVFFEVMLLPMYFLIGIWGGDEPGIRGDQVPALHAVRLGLHPGRRAHPLLLAGRCRRPDHWNATGQARSFTGHSFDIVELTAIATKTGYYGRGDPVLGVHPLLHRLRHQGAVVPVPHLVARRPRRGADADQHDPGRHPAEDRRLRPDPPRLAAVRRRAPTTGRTSWPRWASSTSSTGPSWRWPRPTSRSWSPTARSATWATSSWAWP